MSNFFNIKDDYEANFKRTPKWISEHTFYRKVFNNNDRIVYSELCNRIEFSRKNGWCDNAGNVYVIYPNDDLAKDANVSPRTISRVKKKLVKYGLLKMKKRGFVHTPEGVKNKPSLLFLLQPELKLKDVHTTKRLSNSRDVINTPEKLSNHFNSSGEDNLSLTPQFDNQSDEKGKLSSAKESFFNYSTTTSCTSGQDKMAQNKESNLEDIKKIYKDTQLDFSPTNYPRALVKKQNASLLKQAGKFLTKADNSESYVLSQHLTNIISRWTNTPQQQRRFIQIILNARNSAEKDLLQLNIWKENQVKATTALSGRIEEFEKSSRQDDIFAQHYHDADKDLELTVLKILNTIRSKHDSSKPIQNHEGYLFIALKNHFVTKSCKILEKFINCQEDADKLADFVTKKHKR